MLTTESPTLHVETKGIDLVPITVVQARWFADRVYSVTDDNVYDLLLMERLELKGIKQAEIYATLTNNFGEPDGSFNGEKSSYGYPFWLRRADDPTWKYIMVFRDRRRGFQFDFFKVGDSDVVQKSSLDTEDDTGRKPQEVSREKQLIRGIENEPLPEFTQNDMNAVKDELIGFLERGWDSISSKKETPDFLCYVRSENLIYGKIGGYFSIYYDDEDTFSEALSGYRFVLSKNLS